MDESTSKACVRCNETKPLAEFHRRAKARDGLNSACKACVCAERRQYTAEHPERLRESRQKLQADPAQHAAKLERTRAWRAGNPERRAAYAKAYDLANSQAAADRKRAYYEANREWVLAWPQRNPEASRERFRRYRVRNGEVCTERQRRRRVDKFGGVIGDVDLDALWDGRCGICGGSLDRDLRWPDPMSRSIDHILPLIRGGTHQSTNLQWAHLRCNISKGARIIT